MKFRKTKLTQLFLVGADWKRQRLVDVCLPKHPWKLQYSFPIEQWLRRGPWLSLFGWRKPDESSIRRVFKGSLLIYQNPTLDKHPHVCFSFVSLVPKYSHCGEGLFDQKKNFKTNKLSIYPGNLIWVLKMMLWQNVTLVNIWLFGVST